MRRSLLLALLVLVLLAPGNAFAQVVDGPGGDYRCNYYREVSPTLFVWVAC